MSGKNSQKKAKWRISKHGVARQKSLREEYLPKVTTLDAAHIQQYLAPQFRAVGFIKYGEQNDVSPGESRGQPNKLECFTGTPCKVPGYMGLIDESAQL